MKVYDLREEVRMNLNDQLAVRKKMKPMWMFRDFMDGKFLPSGHLFWCFFGINYPDGIQTDDEAKYTKAYNRIKDGSWKAAEVKRVPGKFIGIASGKTPNDAFRNALEDAGYYNKKTEDMSS